jgi:chemotaxis-related protein WspB
MLYVIVRVAGSTYGIEARWIREVVPRIPLRPLPGSPHYLAGVFDHAGVVVPVLDLGLLFAGMPCPERLNTRILLIDDPQRNGAIPRIGVIAENIYELRELDESAETRDDLTLALEPYLGRFLRLDGQLIQTVLIDKLVPAELLHRWTRLVGVPAG